MRKNHFYIIFSYGCFLGWLLSFPYHGPVLNYLAAIHHVSVSAYSLTYAAAPVIFLIVYSFLQPKEKHSRMMMTLSILACFIGTILLFSFPPSFWQPIFATIGICSVTYIIGWSYFYTIEVSISQKMKIMSAVMIIGNLFYCLISILYNQLSGNSVLFLSLGLLAGSFWSSLKATIHDAAPIELEREAFPVKLIFVICFFLFAINLTDGLTFHSPAFKHTVLEHFSFYGMLPYVLTLFLVFLFGNKIPPKLPIYFGTSFLGLAHLAYGVFGDYWYTYFITETFLQMGWALLDLTLWTLFGMVASIYGRPLKICGFAFLANLSAVFIGGILGVYILSHSKNQFLVSAAFAIGIIFLSLLIIPWMSDVIEKDLRKKLIDDTLPKLKPIPFLLHFKDSLTPRETEIADLIIQGLTNKEIAEVLVISENTLKTHIRKLYSKFGVASRIEFMHLFYTFGSSKEHPTAGQKGGPSPI